MVIEQLQDIFAVWFPSALRYWVLVVGLLAVVATLTGGLIAVLRHGPRKGLASLGSVLAGAVADWLWISPRRVWALAWLVVKESARRRVLFVVLAVFLLLTMLAPWFFDPANTHPARLYLLFVFSSTGLLVLVLSLLLSVFSLPADIRNRTLHTVVTKPVRASEIVLGRMLGFAAVGTGLLAVLSTASYVFVVRGLEHTHRLLAENLKPDGKEEGGVRPLKGLTDARQHHQHTVKTDVTGKGTVSMEHGHFHELSSAEEHGKKTYTLSGPAEMLNAKVPVYGKLRFCDTGGREVEKGINIGDEWVYRSYINGGTKAAAIWTFENVRPERFGDELPIEMNIGIRRMTKGNIGEGVRGHITLRNPATGLRIDFPVFHAKEFAVQTLVVPAELKPSAKPFDNGYVAGRARYGERAADKTEFNVYRDLVGEDGKLEVWLYCDEPSMYFGAGQSDMYLRAADASFRLNFFKGYLGIWLQMVLIVGFGVMFSTFLSGPVAKIATIGVLVAGSKYCVGFMGELARGAVPGGGPFEALYRLFTQDNVVSDLEPGFRTNVMHLLDWISQFFLSALASLLPPLEKFSYSDYVAEGFNISADPLIVVPLVRAAAYLLPLALAGYFFLKTREIAR